MNLKNLHMVHFLGIGGIGMSALARYFHHAGIKVSGYDKVQTTLTQQLLQEGISVHFRDDPELIPEGVELVVTTPAIPGNHKEYNFLKEHGVPILKRAEVLGRITRGKPTIAVAGTHGKTTVSSMLAHILNYSGIPVTAFVGGIMKNYHSNLLMHDNPRWFIVEADEYDRSFLTLNPEMAIITAIDADHLDIYGSHELLRSSFLEFAQKIPANGILIRNEKIARLPFDHPVQLTYGFDPDSQAFISRYKIKNHHFIFDTTGTHNFELKDIKMQIPGRFNMENALAAAFAAHLTGSGIRIREALETYSGVIRRFDYRVNTPRTVYIDDYAHHPEELKACILAVKELYPGKKITGIFQPHLYSRTRDFALEFANSLELLDDIILMDIYPAREQPIEGVDAEMIRKNIRKPSRIISTQEDILSAVAEKQPEVLLTLGAGDIDQLAEPIQELLKEKR